jgi:hypothetical protein
MDIPNSHSTTRLKARVPDYIIRQDSVNALW